MERGDTEKLVERTYIALPERSSVSTMLPTPLSFAGLGMLLCGVVPDGWTAGDGFAAGLLIGLAFVVLAAVRRDEVSSKVEGIADDGGQGLVGSRS